MRGCKNDSSPKHSRSNTYVSAFNVEMLAEMVPESLFDDSCSDLTGSSE